MHSFVDFVFSSSIERIIRSTCNMTQERRMKARDQSNLKCVCSLFDGPNNTKRILLSQSISNLSYFILVDGTHGRALYNLCSAVFHLGARHLSPLPTPKSYTLFKIIFPSAVQVQVLLYETRPLNAGFGVRKGSRWLRLKNY